jgi:hypothetical protein
MLVALYTSGENTASEGRGHGVQRKGVKVFFGKESKTLTSDKQ